MYTAPPAPMPPPPPPAPSPPFTLNPLIYTFCNVKLGATTSLQYVPVVSAPDLGEISAKPTANRRDVPVPVHSSVVPLPTMLMTLHTIGVAVGPKGLCATPSQI